MGVTTEPTTQSGQPASDGKQSGARAVPLALYLRRRARRKLIAWLALLLVLPALYAVDHAGWLLYPGSDMRRYHDSPVTVLRVVDGDTIHVDARDGRQAHTVVRLWGIDTPELARRREGVIVRPAERFAEQAMAMTRRLCEGQRVTLQLEPHSTRGKFGRLLAHVRLRDGTLLNERLLETGMATADDRFSHDRIERYQALERDAKAAGVGLWAK